MKVTIWCARPADPASRLVRWAPMEVLAVSNAVLLSSSEAAPFEVYTHRIDVHSDQSVLLSKALNHDLDVGDGILVGTATNGRFVRHK